jgi:ketosteroid isomerase-like protein
MRGEVEPTAAGFLSLWKIGSGGTNFSFPQIRRTAVNYVGIDLHKKTIVVCVLDQHLAVRLRRTFACGQADAIRDAFAAFLTQFPDLEFVEQEKWVEGWGWVVRWRMSGTLAMPFDTGSGTAEPGGRMDIDALDVITVSDGKLTAKHTYLDWAAALAQMGLA